MKINSSLQLFNAHKSLGKGKMPIPLLHERHEPSLGQVSLEELQLLTFQEGQNQVMQRDQHSSTTTKARRK